MNKIDFYGTQMHSRDFYYWLQGLLDGCSQKPSPAQWDLIVDTVRKLIDRGVEQPFADIPLMLWGFMEINGDQYPDDMQIKIIIEKCYEYIDRVPTKLEQYVERTVTKEAERLYKRVEDEWNRPRDGILPTNHQPIYYRSSETLSQQQSHKIGRQIASM